MKMFCALLISFAFVLSATSIARAQSLRITSPANGTVLGPGETLNVTVESHDESLKAVLLVGPAPINFALPDNGSLTRFHIPIPPRTMCQKVSFSAMGVTTDGKNIESEPVEIDIERPDLPIGLASVNWPKLFFSTPGGQLPIDLIASFSDGQKLDVHVSSRVAYSSTDASVVQVDDQGGVTARMPGKASVMATYRQSGRSVQLVIPVEVSTGAFAASTYSVSFGEQAVGSTSSREILLTNVMNSPASVLSVEVTPLFLETNDCISSLPIRPHSTCSVKVIFRPSRSGPHPGSLTIIDNFSGDRLVIPLNGKGQ